MARKVYIDKDNNFHKVTTQDSVVALPNGTILEGNVFMDTDTMTEQEIEEWLDENQEEQP